MEKDSIDDLHDKLRRLATDSALRNTLERNSLDRFNSTFTAEKMAREVDEIYQSIMRPRMRLSVR